MKYFLAVAENKTDEDSYTSMGLWVWKWQFYMLCCADSNGMNQEYSRNQFNAVKHILSQHGLFELPLILLLQSHTPHEYDSCYIRLPSSVLHLLLHIQMLHIRIAIWPVFDVFLFFFGFSLSWADLDELTKVWFAVLLDRSQRTSFQYAEKHDPSMQSLGTRIHHFRCLDICSRHFKFQWSNSL